MKVSVFILMGSLALAGCAKTSAGGVGDGSVDLVTKLQAHVISVCKFEPTVTTATQLIAAFGGPAAILAEDLLSEIADRVCEAVGTKKVAFVPNYSYYQNNSVYLIATAPAKPKAPVVNGVIIHGKRVK